MTPPEALLVSPAAVTYGQLQAICDPEGDHHGFLFARSGECVGHYVSIKRFTYLFRSGALEPTELLYAILVDPDPNFWELKAGVDLGALARAFSASEILQMVTLDSRCLHARHESQSIQLQLTIWQNGCCDLISRSLGDPEPQNRHYEFRGTDHALDVLQREVGAIVGARSPTRRWS